MYGGESAYLVHVELGIWEADGLQYTFTLAARLVLTCLFCCG